MFEDLEVGDVVLHCEAMLELGIELLVKGVAEVLDNASQKSLADEPGLADKIPVFFLLFALVGSRVGDSGVVRRRFVGDDVLIDVGQDVVFVGANDFGE